MTVQPTYYSGFDFNVIGTPSIVVTRGAFTYAALAFAGQTKFYHPFGDGAATPYNSFAAALQTALNSAASTAGDGGTTWTVAWRHDLTAYVITLSAGTFTAVLDSVARGVLGAFASIAPAVSSWTSDRRPDYCLRPANDAWVSDQHDYEPEGIAVEEETDDGDAFGMARSTSPVYFELTQAYEPMAAVYDEQALSAAPWTWRKFFRHVRNIQPIVLAQAAWTQTSVAYNSADVACRFRLRASGASCKPKRRVAKPAVNLFWDIPLVCRLIDRSVSWSLDFVAGGTFTRTLQAWYQVSAPTTGAVAFLASAGANTRVLENMGDGAGSLLRIEGARTNLCTSRIWSSGTFWIAGTATMTADAAGGIDATSVADECNGTSGQFSTYLTKAADTNTYTASQWQRAKSGTATARLACIPSTPVNTTFTEATLTTTYRRLAATRAFVASAPTIIGFDGRDYTGVGGSGALAADVYGDFIQLEIGAFPSSVIMATTNAGFTRDADVLTFTAAQLPASMFDRPGQFTQVSPEFANTDLASGDTFWLWAIDANNGVRIKHDGTGVCVQAVQGGAVKAQSGYLTFARNGLLGAVRWDPISATVSVNGVAGATGTAWTWTPADIRIGGIPSSTGEAFCRLGTMQNG